MRGMTRYEIRTLADIAAVPAHRQSAMLYALGRELAEGALSEVFVWEDVDDDRPGFATPTPSAEALLEMAAKRGDVEMPEGFLHP